MQQTSVVLAVAAGLLVAQALAGDIGYAGYDQGGYGGYNAPKDYQFEYGVTDPHSGDVKEQREVSKGGEVVGTYSLVEPDGTLRTVHYTADPYNGFKAVVERQGETTYHGHGPH
uniref:Cuticular protein 4 n=1 Tax=Locusta migratoria TaxID=7004 RepID=A0A3S6Q0I8_LOCMI|nr:cuticular protein 4 [Locusta migratoria]